MTVLEAMHQYDCLYPNSFTQEQKTEWLYDADLIIMSNIFDRFEDSDKKIGNGDKTDPDRVLLLDCPYDRAYTYWLSAQTNRTIREDALYNNDIADFYAEIDSCRADYMRTHTPKSAGRILF